MRTITARIITFISVPLTIVFAITILNLAPAAEKKTESKKEPVKIEGDFMRAQGKEGEQIVTVTGNVKVTYRDMVLTAERAVYTEKTKVVNAEGNLKIVDPENEITGEKAVAYLNDRKSVVEGNVKLITKPEQETDNTEGESLRSKYRKPTTITCDLLEYLYRKKIATAKGNLKILQSGRVLTGQEAVYDVNEELVTLTGGVQAVDEKGQIFTSNGTVKASLKEDAEWIEAENGSATLQVDVEEELYGDEESRESSQ